MTAAQYGRNSVGANAYILNQEAERKEKTEVTESSLRARPQWPKDLSLGFSSLRSI
jgi:hypothetical protein